MNNDKLKNELLSNSSHNWIKHRTIILGVVGSHAYGTATEDSDKDYRGVCIPPVSYFLGLDSYNEYNTTGGKNFKNTKDDVDVTIQHINKFVMDAMKGVPNNLELLFLDKDDYVYVSELGQELIDMRHLFLSKRIMKKFGGYARGQMAKMQKGRPELVEKYGYDTKMAMHTVRLLMGAIEILSDGQFTVKKDESDSMLLKDIRNGEWSLNAVLNFIEGMERAMQIAYEDTILPDEPDEERINEMLVDLNWEAIWSARRM